MTDTDRRTAAVESLARAVVGASSADRLFDGERLTASKAMERLEADDSSRAAIVAWLLTPGYADATATGGSYTNTPKTQPPAAQEPKS